MRAERPTGFTWTFPEPPIVQAFDNSADDRVRLAKIAIDTSPDLLVRFYPSGSAEALVRFFNWLPIVLPEVAYQNGFTRVDTRMVHSPCFKISFAALSSNDSEDRGLDVCQMILEKLRIDPAIAEMLRSSALASRESTKCIDIGNKLV